MKRANANGTLEKVSLKALLMVLLLFMLLACGSTTDKGWTVTTATPTKVTQPSRTPRPPQPSPTDTPIGDVPAQPTPTASALATATAEVEVLPPPNIIFIVVDALRPDHVTSYGYERPTTPNLDAMIAAQGVSFQDVSSLSSWTFPANAAMLTGCNPSSIGIKNWSDSKSSLPAEVVLLPEYLHDVGYYTAGFTSAKWAGSEKGFNQGFDVFWERSGTAGERTRAEEINSVATTWLNDEWTSVLSSTQPLFLYLYYFDPHTWYNPPAPYDTMYDSTYTGNLTAEVYQDGIAVASGEIAPTERDVEHLIALYDGEITYWDFHLGEMLTHLDSLHLLDNSIIVVTSDHGQMFGEHGKWTHRNSLYEEVLRVPLFIRYTGVVSAGTVVTAPVETFDLVPTLLDWVGVPAPTVRGVSLRSLAEGHQMTGTLQMSGTLVMNRAIFSEMGVDALSNPDWFTPPHPLRAIRIGEWKYIHHVGHADLDELYRLQPASLYETENVRATETAIADDLFRQLADWYDLPTAYIYLPYADRGGASLTNRWIPVTNAMVSSIKPCVFNLRFERGN